MGDYMNKKRIVASAFALSIGLTACAAEESKDSGDMSDWGDEDAYPEIGGKYHSLTALVGTCAYDTTTNVATVTSTVATTVAQTILIGKRAVDSALLVNGVACGAGTTKIMKKLNIVGGVGDETVIIDFLGGLFAPGVATASAGGIDVALGIGTNDLRIRGTSGKDTFYMGLDNSIAFNADNFKDITMSGVPTVSVALASGDDTFSATNAAAPVLKNGISGTSGLLLTISGGAGNDILTGGSAIDTISGGLGDDTLSGGLGADILNGEAGADTMAGLDVIDGTDDVNCGSEIDTVSYALRTNVITATLNGTGGEGAEADTIENTCENLTGGAGNDVLTGLAAQDNVLRGGAGNDTLVGLSGDDTYFGDAGDDLIDESTTAKGTGADICNGGTGIDTVDYSARAGALTVTMDGKDDDDGEASEGDDVKADVENVVGAIGANTITGNALNNTITGGAAADTLNGGDGNDILIGKALADTLNGGNGDDTFSEEAATNGGDTFNGGDGVDTVDYSLRVAALTVTMDGVAANDGLSGELDNVQEDVENCNGGSAVDSITGNALDNGIVGGGGADTLLSGLAGDDFLDGEGAGAVSIDCGDGDDIAINGSAYVACEL